MTDTFDPRDVACAREAYRRLYPTLPFDFYDTRACSLAACLAREGWVEPDPATAAARKLAAKRFPARAVEYLSGEWDDDSLLTDILTAIRRGIEMGKDPEAAGSRPRGDHG